MNISKSGRIFITLEEAEGNKVFLLLKTLDSRVHSEGILGI